jgi:hypothetical protein
MAQTDDDAAAKGCGIVLVLLFMFFAFMVTMFVGCDVTYSNGHVDGYIQKFSEKGYFIKTWEGELALGGMRRIKDGVTGVWQFSVDDPTVRKAIEDLEPDQPVRLYYRQVWMNAAAFHSSGYRVLRVEVIKEKEKKQR